MRLLKFSEAINEAIFQSMKKDKKMVTYGLGVTDPKRVFDTTNNLLESFGKRRVFDVPTSENALTGIAIGLASKGVRVLLSHQRVDFSFLSLDQIINSMAKWYYMFGGKVNLPITIRMVIGRGWGQGPTHAQSFQSMFSRIPGLKVVMPSNPYDAKGLLISSIFDPDPIIFLEHRWLHNLKGRVPKNSYLLQLGKAKSLNSGKDITIITMSYSTQEVKTLNFILKLNKIKADLIDLRSVNPIDYKLIYRSIKKTKKILLIDTCHRNGSVSSEILSRITETNIEVLKSKIIALPDYPVPTSYKLVEDYYPSTKKIFLEICKILELKNPKIPKNYFITLDFDKPPEFKGPF